jgi:uncharacterized RDD family membrane protein YckC
MTLTGDASKSRIFAFILDNLLACLISLLTVGALGSDSSVIAGTTLCGVYLLYFFLFESAFSRTPGKFLQGLVIRKMDGSKCGIKDHLIRTAARIVEANPLLLGGVPAGIAIFASTQKQRIGDSLAGTVVISKQMAAMSDESN